MIPLILFPVIGKYLGWLGSFNLCMTTDLGEGKLWIQTSFWHFYEQRKYVNKTEKRQTHQCTTKQFGLLTAGRDMRLLTWKRTVLTLCAPIKCTSACHGGFQVSSSVSHVCVLPVLTIPGCTVLRRLLPLSLRGNNFNIFFVRSYP